MQGIIDIEPKHYLDFEAEENKLAHTQLYIKNLTGSEITFKIKTTVPNLFQVKPSVDLIPRDSQAVVQISTTQPAKQDPKIFDSSKFQINACIKDSPEAGNLFEYRDLSVFWRNRDQSTVQQILLKCRVKPPSAAPENPLQEAQQLESSIVNSTTSESKLFKSVINEGDHQKDQELKAIKEKYEKMEIEYQNMRKQIESQKQPQQQPPIVSTLLNTKQVLVIVILALLIGYFMGG